MALDHEAIYSAYSGIVVSIDDALAATKYQRDRAAEYPSWQDQLDKIYHSGIDAWKADIKAIKDKYPKP